MRWKTAEKTVHPLLEEWLDRFRRHIATGETRAAGGDHHLYGGIGDPGRDLLADGLDLVAHDSAIGERVAGLRDARGERIAGAVLREITRVGDGQHGDRRE